MFSGLGSQYYHMGKELFDTNPIFNKAMQECDTLVLRFAKESFIKEMYGKKGKNIPFDNLLLSATALLSIEYSLAQLLIQSHIYPQYLLGYSLGNITAAVVSEAMALDNAIEFLVDLTKEIQNHTNETEMLAILAPISIVQECIEQCDHVYITGENFDENFVVTGLPSKIERLVTILNAKKILFQKLPVKYGFHTKVIDSIKPYFDNTFPSRYKVQMTKYSICSEKFALNEHKVNPLYFWNAIRKPINFKKIIKELADNDRYTFIDVGPSGTLATFVKYLLPHGSESTFIQSLNPFGNNCNTIDVLIKSLR